MSVHAVVAPPSRELNRFAVSRRSHHPGVMAIDVPPGTKIAYGDVSDAILAGLGKDADLSAAKRSSEPLAAAWLSLGEVQHAIVVDAQLLAPVVLTTLITAFDAAGVDTWLLLAAANGSDTAVSAHLNLVADFDGDVIGEAQLRDAFPDMPRTIRRMRPPTRLPRVDGIVFRSACRDLLTKTEFANVDARFVSAVAHARELLASLSGVNKTRSLERALKPWLGAAPNTDELVLRTRAMQVAAIPAGFHVRVDTTVLLGATTTLARPGLAGPGRWWEQFDRYRDPDPGAAAAIYSAGGDAADLPTINLEDVTFDGPGGGPCEAKVRTGDQTVTVTGPAVRFVRALVGFRLICGAGPTDRLFVTHRADATRFRHITRTLAAAEGELGVSVATAPVRKQHPDADTWLARYGVTITKLGYTPISPTREQ